MYNNVKNELMEKVMIKCIWNRYEPKINAFSHSVLPAHHCSQFSNYLTVDCNENTVQHF
jgi:hypothetical protein